MAAIRRNGLALSILLVRVTIASPYLRPFSSTVTTATGNGGTDRGSPEFWYHLTISMALVLAGGVFAGYVVKFGEMGIHLLRA
jgi:metal transporter CNNM